MKRLALLIIAGSVLMLVGVILFQLYKQHQQAAMPFIDESTLHSLPSKDTSHIDTSHLKDGLTPPTNKWFTGLALQKTPQTVFPCPLSFATTETSFSFSLPTVTATANTIFGSHSNAITVTIAHAAQYQVTRYDELSVDLTYYDSNHGVLGTVTLIAGSPYIFFHSAASTNIAMSSSVGAISLQNNKASVAAPTPYIIAGFDGAKLSSTDAGTQATASLQNGSLLSFYTLPAGLSADPLFVAAGNRITGTSVAYVEKGNEYETTFQFHTANGGSTYYGLLPHQISSIKPEINYNTTYGELRVSKTASISFTTPSVPLSDTIDLTHISKDDKELLVTTLRRDINATQFTADDTYFGGKGLYRSAQLLTLAKQLKEDNIASTIQQKLRSELTTWLSTTQDRTKKDFYYDSKMHSIVGDTASFGSEDINDHHFHYGYFIYAASVLAKYDPEFLSMYAPVINLLVGDIANYRSNELLPLRRSFDPYFGHSWASGSAPFNDGNNQESSSEAINAWVAVGLWGAQTNNDQLKTEAGWMLSNEVKATSSYWLNFAAADFPYNQGYAHSLVSLNWGGKRDYATFFSSQPAAILGIQLIPLSPTMLSTLQNNKNINSQINEATANGGYNQQFGDYLLMYTALQKRPGLLASAKALPDSSIDSANSRSYLYAWIMSQTPQ